MRKGSFLVLEALPPDLRDLSRSCHPRLSRCNRRGGLRPPRTWSGPGVSAQVASLQSLTLCSGQHQANPDHAFTKLVVVVDREE